MECPLISRPRAAANYPAEPGSEHSLALILDSNGSRSAVTWCYLRRKIRRARLFGYQVDSRRSGDGERPSRLSGKFHELTLIGLTCPARKRPKFVARHRAPRRFRCLRFVSGPAG